jgi:hypothetical protein
VVLPMVQNMRYFPHLETLASSSILKLWVLRAWLENRLHEKQNCQFPSSAVGDVLSLREYPNTSASPQETPNGLGITPEGAWDSLPQ